MNANTRDKHAYSEADIQSAIAAYRSRQYTTVRQYATAFSIPHPTLQYRLSGRLSRSTSYETMQILSKPEERTLVRWITHLTNTGYLASPALVMQIADEIRYSRFQLSTTLTSYLRPVGKNWLNRFRKRYPEIQGI